jgi:hypothetical protein
MNKNIVTTLFIISTMLPIFTSPTQAGVREEMWTIPTTTALKTYYDANGLYKKRYVLKELPDWLKLNGITTPPSWLLSTLLLALDTKEPMLVIEATTLEGLYRYTDTSIINRLMTNWYIAHVQYAAEAEQVRGAIVQTLCKMFGSGPNVDSLFFNFFMTKPRYLHSEDFMLLLANINPSGCTGCESELDDLKQEVTEKLLAIQRDPGNTPPREKDFYQRLLSTITTTQNRFSEAARHE